MAMELGRKIGRAREVAVRSGKESAREGERTWNKGRAGEGGGCEIGNRDCARKIGQEMEVAARTATTERARERSCGRVRCSPYPSRLLFPRLRRRDVYARSDG
ncbi:hypothetical protein ACLOJK_036811 [Asimina triloba]